jgi:hypothetical protein
LDVVARRPIKKDEQITMDYATFCVNMTEFVCQCGAQNCRGIIKGTDYLEPWVETLYGDHISDYVRTKRRERALKANTTTNNNYNNCMSSVKNNSTISNVSNGPLRNDNNTVCEAFLNHTQ